MHAVQIVFGRSLNNILTRGEAVAANMCAHMCSTVTVTYIHAYVCVCGIDFKLDHGRNRTRTHNRMNNEQIWVKLENARVAHVSIFASGSDVYIGQMIMCPRRARGVRKCSQLRRRFSCHVLRVPLREACF